MQKFQRDWTYGSRLYRHFSDAVWRPLINAPARTSAILFSFVFLLTGALLCTRLLGASFITSRTDRPTPITTKSTTIPELPPKEIEIPLNCSAGNFTTTCPANYYPSNFHPEDQDRSPPASCPDYFSWLYDDLRPWARTGITRDMLERANRTANFRLVIVKGRAYIQKYRRAFQTRDVFTLWGVLQLLRKYPGKVPDLELMFDCVDWPVIRSRDYSGPNTTAPPPLFRYCGNDATLDIVFPDWSFWGWPEINIKPWDLLLKDIGEGNKKVKWMEREPHAFWKGNPMVSKTRLDLLKCNVSDKQDWNARIFSQDWIQESKQGYKQSDLGNQCTYRYKIYIEGSAWSVSQKYILACDSVSLLVKPHYYDFFSRSLKPVHHYWPVQEDDKCKSIKFAVEWGNSHKKKAQEIGKAGSDFIQNDLKMDLVYDYMFHLLNEYAKLLKFKPRVPSGAVELCSEMMACPSEGLEKKFKMESMVKGPSVTSPCTMPPPHDTLVLHSTLRRKENSIKQVEIWENKYWASQNS